MPSISKVYEPPNISVTPPEILKRGPEAVRAFHKALREGRQKLLECKLVVLGEEWVGKTSLIRHMTGRLFEPNLNRTCGIENQCIKTMIDKANIDTSKWITINENEQAMRDQEYFINGIAQAVKKEDPSLLETKTTRKRSDSDTSHAESLITEDQLLAQIHEHLKHLHQAEQQRIEQQRERIEQQRERIEQQQERIEQHRIEHQGIEQQTLQQDAMGNIANNKISAFITPISQIQTVTLPDERAPCTTDHNISLSPSDVKQKPSSKHESVVPVPIPKHVAQVIQLEHQNSKIPIAALKSEVPVHGSLLGRYNSRIIYNQLPSAASKNDEPVLSLEVLDFAGQKEYRPMHHCFMSRHAIYIVVSNLQQLCNPSKSGKTFADLKYWLNSIHAHVHNPGYTHDKYIFLVGTHKNPGGGQREITDNDLEKLSNDLERYLFGGSCRFKDEIHFYSNTDLIITGMENSLDQSKSGIEIIKKEIEIFSKHLPFLAETYPNSWINFRAKLLKKKLDISPILELSEAKQMAKDSGVDETAVDTALQFFHDCGVIIHPGKPF